MSSDFIELRVDDPKIKTLTNILVESKVDGCRMRWNGSDLISERGIVRNDRFLHIVTDLKKMNFKGEGEVAIPFGNVLTLNKKENWHKARFYAFKMNEWNGQNTEDANAEDNRKLIEDMMLKAVLQTSNIRIPFKFKSFQDGWNWVLKKNLEGLVLKEIHGSKTFKVKRMHEEKLQVVGFVPGSVKGCFQIVRNGVVGGVSALSTAYVQQYKDMLAKGLQVWAEIEYLFLTEGGVPFQPRLRRLGTLQELQTAA